MSNLKKVWMVTRVIACSEGVVATSSVLLPSEEEARENLRDFQRCQQKTPELCNGYQTVVSGDVDHDHAPEGRKYYGVMRSETIDPDELEDAFRPYTVEVEVTRKYNLTITVDEAEDIVDAKDKARNAIKDGDHDYEMDCHDEQDIEIHDCYEY